MKSKELTISHLHPAAYLVSVPWTQTWFVGHKFFDDIRLFLFCSEGHFQSISIKIEVCVRAHCAWKRRLRIRMSKRHRTLAKCSCCRCSVLPFQLQRDSNAAYSNNTTIRHCSPVCVCAIRERPSQSQQQATVLRNIAVFKKYIPWNNHITYQNSSNSAENDWQNVVRLLCSACRHSRRIFRRLSKYKYKYKN